MSAKIRACIVGAGGWGEQHARSLAAREDVELTAICARTARRVEPRAAKYRCTAYTDLDAMLAKEKPDVVFLSLPNKGHVEATMRVIEAGVPLVAEKPLCFDVAEGERMIAEARKRRLFFAINFNHRYAKALTLAKRAIVDGKIGDVVYATWRFGGEGGACLSHENIIESQCHGFDQLEWLCGPIASLSAHAAALPGRGSSTFAVAASFASGGVGSMLGTYDQSYAQQDTHRLEIGGTRGRVVVEDTVKRFSFQAHGDETAQVWEAGYFNDRDRQFHLTMDAHVEAILGALRAGAPPPVPADAGLRALVLARAAIASFAGAGRVATPLAQSAAG